MPEVQRSVGRYELLEVVGRGGAATVYLAIQRDLNRQVALKELAAQHVADADFAERFVQESRLAGGMSHPNIVTVHEFFEHDGIPYIAMEYLARGSLRPYMGRLSTAQVIGVLESVLAGLSHGESQGVVHRDLKPENLLVAADGRVKIADFGVARAYNVAATRAIVTAAGTTIGTPAYMAPEQALGTQLTPATDLYSLGIIAWEMLTGETPFDSGDTPVAVLYRQVHEPLRPVREVDPEIDERLAEWLQRLLAKRPEDRFQTAEAAWEPLEDLAIDLLGPRWRRGARLSAEQPEAAPRPLTPAPFTSGTPASESNTPVVETLSDAEAPPARETPPPSQQTPPPGPETPPRGPATPSPSEETQNPKQETPPPGRETIVRPGRRHRAAPEPAAAEAGRRPRRALWAAVAAVTVVAAGAGVAVGLTSETSPRPPRARTVTTTPTAVAVDASLHPVLQRLATARKADIYSLNHSRTAAGQAAAARRLAGAYGQAASGVGAVRGAPTALRPALAGLASAYRSLAAAATARNATHYRRLTAQIGTQETRLQAVVRGL